ncbi:MAG TPA: hypothetical protein DCS63_10000 [Elusimicrobia bacterium]|nr:hypothetical protein [Elusimicrobiota bacterium]
MFIKLKVHPGARRDKLLKKAPDAYEIWTKSPPERGLANASALRQLSIALGIDVKKIMLIKGATSPAKIVKIISPEIEK